MTYHSARRHGAWLMALLLFITMMPTNAMAATVSLFSDPVAASGFVPDPGWNGQPGTLGENYTEVTFSSSNEKTLTVGVFKKDGVWYLLLSRDIKDGSYKNHNIQKIELNFGETTRTITNIPPYDYWHKKNKVAYYALALGDDVPYQIGVKIDTGAGGHSIDGYFTLGAPKSIVVRHVLLTPAGNYTHAIQTFNEKPGVKEVTINQIGPVSHNGATYHYAYADEPIDKLPYTAKFKDPVKNYTLYYDEMKYNVSYEISGAPAGTSYPIDTTKYHAGEQVTVLPHTVVPGYTFAGWLYNGITYPAGAKLTMPAGDVKLTGVYSAIPYAVKYETSGAPAGQGAPPVDSNEYNVGDEVTVLPHAEVPGYNFAGWLYNGITYPAGAKLTMPVGNVTLTGVYSAIPYAVKYETSGAPAGQGTPPVDSNEYNVGDEVTVLPHAEVLGYTFEGWLYNGITYPAGAKLSMTAGDVLLTGVYSRSDSKISVVGTKRWAGDEDYEFMRPTEIEIGLYADDATDPIRTATAKASDNPAWQYSFEQLDEFRYDEDGIATRIQYRVEEINPAPNYFPSAVEDSYDILNTFVVPRSSFAVQKIWRDDGESRYLTKIDVTLQGYVGDTPLGDDYKFTASIKKSEGWTYVWTSLPKFVSGSGELAGQPITYKVTENVPAGYAPIITPSEAGATITNVKLTSFEVEKKWRDGKGEGRPQSVRVTLKASDGHVIPGAEQDLTGPTWSYKWNNLPKYTEDGTKITYSIEESEVPGYASSIKAKSDGKGATITNTKLTTVEVEKKWLDGNSKDRPKTVNVTLRNNRSWSIKEATLEGPEWTYTWEDLPQYTDDNRLITYTVTETVPKGYGESYKTEGNKVTITNTKLTSFKVEKKWRDDSKLDRPLSVKVTLRNDKNSKVDNTLLVALTNWTYTWKNLPQYTENDELITYYVTEDVPSGYAATITPNETGATITNVKLTSFEVEKKWRDGTGEGRPQSVKVTLKASDNHEISGAEQDLTGPSWKYKWNGLPKYTLDGAKITYSVEESDVPGYASSIKAKSDGKGATVTNTKLTTVEVEKKWLDGNDADRPKTVNVTLRNNRSWSIKEATLEGPEWTYTWEDLPQYTDDNRLITYTVTETVPKGYTESYAIEGTKTTITNTKLTSFEVEKKWLDGGEGRPDAVKVTLSASDGHQIPGAEQRLTRTKGWKYTWKNLPMYTENDEPIEYSVTEEVPAGYAESYATNGNKTTITNTKLTSFEVEKKWLDGGSSNRPQSVTVTLSASDGHEISGAEQNLTSDNGWKYTWENLPQYTEENGKIEYSVTEEVPTGYAASYATGGNKTTITNTKLTSFEVEKKWLDGGEEDRPQTVKVTLSASDGHQIPGAEQNLTGDNGWKYTWVGLPQYTESDDQIEYSVTEEVPTGYAASYAPGENKTTITNTKISDVTITKIWDDGDAFYRPATPLTLALLKRGEPFMSATIENPTSSGASWTHTFDNLPEYDENGKIEYSVFEPDVPAAPRYEATYDGLTVTNTSFVTITFVDYDNTVLKQVRVKHGGSTTAPTVTSSRPNFTFTGWDKPSTAWENVKRDTTIYAQYALIEEAVTELAELGIPLAGGTVTNVGDSFD